MLSLWEFQHKIKDKYCLRYDIWFGGEPPPTVTWEREGAVIQPEPRLTLEFLEECIQGFAQSSIELKHLCLEYMTLWLPNLAR